MLPIALMLVSTESVTGCVSLRQLGAQGRPWSKRAARWDNGPQPRPALTFARVGFVQENVFLERPSARERPLPLVDWTDIGTRRLHVPWRYPTSIKIHPVRAVFVDMCARRATIIAMEVQRTVANRASSPTPIIVASVRGIASEGYADLECAARSM